MKKENPFSAHSRQRQLETPDHVQDYVRVTSVSPFLIGLTILLLLGAFVVWGIHAGCLCEDGDAPCVEERHGGTGMAYG